MVRCKDIAPVVSELNLRYGGLLDVMSAAEQLIGIEGVGETTAIFVQRLQTIMVDALEAQIEMPSNWITAAENCLQDCQAAYQNALLDKAALLLSEALRNRLAQGDGEPFIDALLETNSPKSMVDTLVEQLAKAPDGEFDNKFELLRRNLQHIAVEIEQEQS